MTLYFAAVKPVRIYLVEDEPLIAEDLRTSIEDLGYSVCGHAENALDAIAGVATERPDLILMDIDLDGELDGVHLAEKVNEKFPTPFIFVTSHADKGTIERVKRTRPAGFIVKPFDENDLRSNIEIALFRHANDLDPAHDTGRTETGEFVIADSIFVKDKGRLLKVPFADILYAEAYDNYTKLYTLDQRFTVSATLKAVADRLAGPPFLRVHRSFLVNVEHIRALEEGYVQVGKQRIPVGKTFKEELMRAVRTL